MHEAAFLCDYFPIQERTNTPANKDTKILLKRLLPVTILAACTIVALASKPRVKKAAKKTIATHREKASGAKRDTTIIKFNPDSVQAAPEGVLAE